MTREEMENRMNAYMSGENKKTIKKIGNYIFKIYNKNKNNDYVNARDIIVLAYFLLINTTDLEKVPLTSMQKQDLKKLIEGLFEDDTSIPIF